jgi:glyoxylase-like metal-dependent hydrolase (beta-lactamase superfamily II)
VLIDPGFTAEQARVLGDWVASKDRNVSDIFITHGHGDHWFATGLLAERFGAPVVATAGTISQMHANVAARPFVWDKVYPGIPLSPVTAVTVPDNQLMLEGKDLVIVEVGHTDTEATSVLHVPDLGLVVAGDVIYNGAHLYLSESSLAGLDKWRSAIDQVEALGARHIVAGHQNSKLDDDAARTIADTREYLDVAEEQLRTQYTAADYFNAMVERYPDRLGRTVLWATAQAVFGIREHPGEDPTQFIAAGWL